jgi:uncharacterized protein YbaR (Trm112 family)
MKRATLPLLGCPTCQGGLVFSGDANGEIHSGTLTCSACQKTYSIQQDIPHFIEPEQLNGFNRRFSRMYDLFAWGYRLFSKSRLPTSAWTKKPDGVRSPTGSTRMAARCWRFSIGPGVNLPYLVNRQDVREIFGLDISLGQLQHCQSYVRKQGWDVDLFLGNGEQLPFRDESFDGVFHVGGINFFNNKKAAIEEMIRVAKPGVRILIADETEKGAQGYEKFIPGFKGSFRGKREVIKPPIDLVPNEMFEMRVFDVWKGWLYCIEFRKP